MSLGPGNKAQFGQIVIFGSSDFNMLGDDLVLGLIEQLVKKKSRLLAHLYTICNWWCDNRSQQQERAQLLTRFKPLDLKFSLHACWPIFGGKIRISCSAFFAIYSRWMVTILEV